MSFEAFIIVACLIHNGQVTIIKCCIDFVGKGDVTCVLKVKLFVLTVILTAVVLFFTTIPGTDSLKEVFRLTDEPGEVIVRGMAGSALTINISFGEEEVEQLVRDLQTPYPVLFLDMDWAERFPEIVALIKKRNIPVGLLGHAGEAYEQDIPLLMEQISKFESHFGTHPLWFRTADEQFPLSLRTALWDVEINALGSSVKWIDGEPPPVIEGEIISLPHHREERVSLASLKKLNETRKYTSLENVLFKMSIKTKRIPE